MVEIHIYKCPFKSPQKVVRSMNERTEEKYDA